MHKLLSHPALPGRMFQQNHFGVFRSDNFGETWTAIHKGLPYEFGFGLALDPNDPEACYTVPLQPEGYAWRATDGTLRVYRWSGKGWQGLDKGMPREAFVSVLREGMSNDTLKPGGIYVGAGTGQVFASRDAGKSWSEIASHLPPVLSVSASVV